MTFRYKNKFVRICASLLVCQLRKYLKSEPTLTMRNFCKRVMS